MSTGRNVFNFLFKIKELCKVNARYRIHLAGVEHLLRTVKLESFNVQRPREERTLLTLLRPHVPPR